MVDSLGISGPNVELYVAECQTVEKICAENIDRSAVWRTQHQNF
jgi:hypothetical protein